MKNYKKIIKEKINALLEAEYSKDMEVAFGVPFKNDNLSSDEERQFGSVDTNEISQKGLGSSNDSRLKSIKDKSGTESKDYYKSVNKKMKDFQDLNQKDEDESPETVEEAFKSPKVNVNTEDEEEDFMYNGHMGTGMSGLRYDNEGDEVVYDTFGKRIDKLSGGKKMDSSYKKLKNYGEKYKKYKYGEKYKKTEDDYIETPKVRTTKNESIAEYVGVEKTNVFRSNGKLVSEQQVLEIANKVPNRIKIDETEFAITDGENTYKLIWEGDDIDGEASIKLMKNVNKINENIDNMKHLWSYKSNDNEHKKPIDKKSEEDIFKKLFRTNKPK
jgi:hypothetical protein